MSALLDKIRAHNRSVPKLAIEVAEWGTTLYFLPLTPAQTDRAKVGIKTDADAEAAVALLMDTALDEHGNKAFDNTAEEKAELMGRSAVGTIMRIVKQVIGDLAPEADLKND